MAHYRSMLVVILALIGESRPAAAPAAARHFFTGRCDPRADEPRRSAPPRYAIPSLSDAIRAQTNPAAAPAAARVR